MMRYLARRYSDVATTRALLWDHDDMSTGFTSLAKILAQADRRLAKGESAGGRVWPTGFAALDECLSGGGLRAGDLLLLGGAQGLGKTTFALQMLRNIVAAGNTGLFFSFEHDEESVLERLLALEIGESDDPDAPDLDTVREAFLNADGAASAVADALAGHPGGTAGIDRMRAYADRFLVMQSSGGWMTLEAIREHVTKAAAKELPVVVVDYLQKIPVPGSEASEDERVTTIVQGLKDLAMELEAPIVAIVAADKAGITSGKRLRVHNLRGSSALAYEADIVLVLNDKYDVVARHHLVYDLGQAERFREWAVLTVEKNRSGIDHIDLEFRKMFHRSRYDSAGQEVREQLVDERVFVE